MMWGKAMLMGDAPMVARMLTVSNPRALKPLGRDVKPFIDVRGREHGLAIMVQGSYLKLSQNAAMAAELLATRMRKLVEANPHDCIRVSGWKNPTPAAWMTASGWG